MSETRLKLAGAGRYISTCTAVYARPSMYTAPYCTCTFGLGQKQNQVIHCGNTEAPHSINALFHFNKQPQDSSFDRCLDRIVSYSFATNPCQSSIQTRK